MSAEPFPERRILDPPLESLTFSHIRSRADGFGSSTLATWLQQKALELYGETVEEYNSEYAVESEGNRRKLTAGAGTPVNVTDPEVVAAARAGMEFVVREKQTNGENTFLMVLSVRRGTQQIVVR